MFLDSFPMHEPEVRTARPARETPVETGKSRSAWPFIVGANGFGVSHASRNARDGMLSMPASAFPAPDSSSFVT
jgi:hypothetical protein